ncbi:hypothetical protein E2C01_064389 [Portunus trituberculatus]|uniref:Uncharacterized protein n=1 Tax=Portunus trituberculatus TaxID=210409 RepID=A0A5B7HCW1_PORTR|nr:hypothetical protein [Portunus trituberculatus]
MNRNGEILEEFVDEMELENLNVTLAGGCVSHMWIDEDGVVDIVSDHNMLVMEGRMQSGSEVRVVGKERRWKLRDVGWENYQVDLSERRWDDDVSVYDVEHLNERLVENVRSAAENQIGFVRVGRRKRVCKPWWNDEIREARKERKRMRRQCKWLRKKRHESDEVENEFLNAGAAYVKQQRSLK